MENYSLTEIKRLEELELDPRQTHAIVLLR